MTTINEEIYRLREIMGIEEESNSSSFEGSEGYDDSCDCYPKDRDAIEGEIEEQGEGGESSPSSSSSMEKWDTGISRGSANPIDVTSRWETGITRGKGNPVW